VQKGLANSVKHVEAGGKEVASSDVLKATNVRTMNSRAEGPQDSAGVLEKRSSGGLDSCSQQSVTSTQKPAAAMKQTSPLAPPQNRFKLDNRITSFRILPPLPPEIANVSQLLTPAIFCIPNPEKIILWMLSLVQFQGSPCQF
jgi:RNA-binding protein 26